MLDDWFSYSRRLASPLPIAHTPGPSQHRSTEADSFSTVSWQDLPPWQQDNEFILSDYRPESRSFYLSLRSLRYIHNETVNIYSHLFGAIFFAIFPIYLFFTLSSSGFHVKTGDIIALSAFFSGVAICFSLSAYCHIVANHSEKVAAWGKQLDYVGIVVLMWGAMVPSVFYGFYCGPKLQKIYWAIITTLATIRIAVALYPKFRLPRFQPYRAAIHSTLGIFAIVFIVHGIVLHGWVLQSRRMSLMWIGIMGALNLLGSAAFATRFPEGHLPGRYDIIGNSHQILHFMVIFAILAHMVGLLKAFDYLHAQANACNIEWK